MKASPMDNIAPEMLEIILRHLQKAASQPEEERLATWLEESPENKAGFREVESIWRLSDAGLPDFEPDTEQAWNILKQKMEAPISSENGKRNHGKVISITSWTWKVAASVLVVIGLWYGWSQFWKTEEVWTNISSGDDKKLVYLPDSSEVWLNRNSSLSFTDFQGNTRNVKLSGEAFFQVKRRPEQAFIIEGNQSITKVLGTSFNLKTRAGEPDQLQVVTGLVAFSSLALPQNPIKVKAGEKAEIQNNKPVQGIENPDQNFLSWKTNRLEFQNMPLKQVLSKLETQYNIHWEVQDSSIYRCRFTGTFNQAPLSEVLEVMSVSVNLKIEQKDSIYRLSGGGCP